MFRILFSDLYSVLSVAGRVLCTQLNGSGAIRDQCCLLLPLLVGVRSVCGQLQRSPVRLLISSFLDGLCPCLGQPANGHSESGPDKIRGVSLLTENKKMWQTAEAVVENFSGEKNTPFLQWPTNIADYNCSHHELKYQNNGGRYSLNFSLWLVSSNFKFSK